MIKNELKELLSQLIKVEAQTKIFTEYKNGNDRKIFSIFRLTASDSEIDEAFIGMYQSVMKKIKIYDSKDLIVLDVNIKHSIKILLCYYNL